MSPATVGPSHLSPRGCLTPTVAAAGVLSPLLWGWLYAYFSSPPVGLPWLLRLGPGGVFTCAGWLNVLAWWFVKSLDRKDLFIDDDTPAKDESQD